MGKSKIRTVGKVDLAKPVSTQTNLHVSPDLVTPTCLYIHIIAHSMVADWYQLRIDGIRIV